MVNSDDAGKSADSTSAMMAATGPLAQFMELQSEAIRTMFAQGNLSEPTALDPVHAARLFPAKLDQSELADWTRASLEIQKLWFEFISVQARKSTTYADTAKALFDPTQWANMAQMMMRQMPVDVIETQTRLAAQSMQLWQTALESMASIGTQGGAKPDETPDAKPSGGVDADRLPYRDRRFADPAWRENPAAILLHQNYLMISEYLKQAAASIRGLDEETSQQLQFAVSALAEALSPGNFLATNPQVLQRTIETRGDNLVRGMRHLIADLQRGQLTHTDADAFALGENLAVTPGKVVHETPLYQLIQYSPTTKEVLETPLVIFPPWINRFYILDLTPEKSFIRWAVEQGITVFVASWKSADATMKDVVWDDYIRAQIEAVDVIRERLSVPDVHTIGYCVAGTTLAATLAILARRGEADRVKSATFFTAQIDFERSGDLKHFIEDRQLELIGQLSPDGYLDGRYLAATFNALRGKDLIWNYVVNNYLLGEDYPAFDLLHWNGDVTNLPAKWHNAYLRDLYRGNKLVKPDAMEADGTPIDLGQVKTPAFVQAGREDHIAPAESVWRMTDHFSGPIEFVLAGSGHIAGVVNPPAAKKYQYWTGDSSAKSLDTFVNGAEEHPGSWWPYWLEWLKQQSNAMVPATGKRKPGGRGDSVIEDAPGRYVKTR